MDYAGLDYPGLRFPVSRPLTDDERNWRYEQKKPPLSKEPNDFLSVIKFNSRYIDLVDRWYPIKGFNVWFGGALMMSCVAIVSFMIHSVITRETETIAIAIFVVFGSMFMLMAYGGYWLIRTECGRWTHYPMRLNRETRMVYVFRQNGTVLETSWDTLFIVRGEAKNPMAGTTWDLRAHVLDEDGVTVRESFSLGYTSPSEEDSMNKFWAFLQPYMEAPDGVERAHRILTQNGEGTFLLALDKRKEGWRWSITRTFAPFGRWPWLQLLGSPYLTWNTTGRILAMWTSRQPVWPEDVERANPVDPDDPYALTWHNNSPLNWWWEFGWPLVCTVIGWGLTIGVLWWVFSRM